jgi:hypothetical protein
VEWTTIQLVTSMWHVTSRKRPIYPGSRGPFVPVPEPGLKGRY